MQILKYQSMTSSQPPKECVVAHASSFTSVPILPSSAHLGQSSEICSFYTVPQVTLILRQAWESLSKGT